MLCMAFAEIQLGRARIRAEVFVTETQSGIWSKPVTGWDYCKEGISHISRHLLSHKVPHPALLGGGTDGFCCAPYSLTRPWGHGDPPPPPTVSWPCDFFSHFWHFLSLVMNIVCSNRPVTSEPCSSGGAGTEETSLLSSGTAEPLHLPDKRLSKCC